MNKLTIHEKGEQGRLLRQTLAALHSPSSGGAVV
jgi:hypothetical protein